MCPQIETVSIYLTDEVFMIQSDVEMSHSACDEGQWSQTRTHKNTHTGGAGTLHCLWACIVGQAVWVMAMPIAPAPPVPLRRPLLGFGPWAANRLQLQSV